MLNAYDECSNEEEISDIEKWNKDSKTGELIGGRVLYCWMDKIENH